MARTKEIIFKHSVSEESVTQEQIHEVEEILAATLFREWLKAKGFPEEKK